MKRREVMAGLAGAALWPLSLHAQQGVPARPVPRLGVLSQGRQQQLPGSWEAFADGLQRLGWSDGSTIQIERRFAENDPAKIRAFATELVGLKPDVIFAVNTLAVAELQRETKTIPIVFASVTDPVASGFVASLARPAGNITGFSNFAPTLAGKHIEILKELVPGLTTVSDMFNPDNNPAHRETVYPILEAAAKRHRVELVAAPVRNDADIEHVIANLGGGRTTGLLIAGEPFLNVRLELIIPLVTHKRIVTVCPFRQFAERGCLISYGSDLIEEFDKAPGYIDRILKGAKPADLPVQQPSKFQMIVNLKTAKAMGLAIPQTLLDRADDVIE